MYLEYILAVRVPKLPGHCSRDNLRDASIVRIVNRRRPLMLAVVVPSTAGVVVTPPRPKPPRRVKDDAESERRIAAYQQQRTVYEEAMHARKLAFMQRKHEPLGPKPPLPKKPRKPRSCKGEDETLHRVAEYQQLLAEYEKALQAHKELMAERKRATDRRSRPEDDGERAAKRRRVRLDERRRQIDFHVSVSVGRKQAPMTGGVIKWDKRKRM